MSDKRSESSTWVKRPPLWHRDFTLISLANLIMAVPFYFMMVLIPLFLEQELHCEKHWVGYVMASYTLAAIVARPITGALLDALGRRRIYLFTFSLFTVCFLGYPLIVSVIGVLSLRFLHGIAWGGMSTSGNTVAIDLTPPSRRGEGIGIFGLSMTLAMAVGPSLGLGIWRYTQSFSVAFYIAAALCAVGLILGITVRIPTVKISHTRTQSLWGRLRVSQLFSRDALPAACLVLWLEMPYGLLMGFITLYAKSLPQANAALFFLLYAIGVMVTRFTAGRIYDKWGPKSLVPVGISLLTVGFLMLCLWVSTVGYYWSALPLGLGYGILSPTLQAMANQGVATQHRGAANSTFLTFFDMGIGCGMVGFGVLLHYTSYAISFAMAALLVLLGLPLFYGIILPRSKVNRL